MHAHVALLHHHRYLQRDRRMSRLIACAVPTCHKLGEVWVTDHHGEEHPFCAEHQPTEEQSGEPE
jgi:hypothetical protein